jgi:hypothetical protein
VASSDKVAIGFLNPVSKTVDIVIVGGLKNLLPSSYCIAV